MNGNVLEDERTRMQFCFKGGLGLMEILL